jgi:hypothetical protein
MQARLLRIFIRVDLQSPSTSGCSVRLDSLPTSGSDASTCSLLTPFHSKASLAGWKGIGRSGSQALISCSVIWREHERYQER